MSCNEYLWKVLSVPINLTRCITDKLIFCTQTNRYHNKKSITPLPESPPFSIKDAFCQWKFALRFIEDTTGSSGYLHLQAGFPFPTAAPVSSALSMRCKHSTLFSPSWLFPSSFGWWRGDCTSQSHALPYPQRVHTGLIVGRLPVSAESIWGHLGCWPPNCCCSTETEWAAHDAICSLPPKLYFIINYCSCLVQTTSTQTSLADEPWSQYLPKYWGLKPGCLLVEDRLRIQL